MRKTEYKTRRIRPKTFFLRKSKGRNFSIKKSLKRAAVFLKGRCVISEKKTSANTRGAEKTSAKS